MKLVSVFMPVYNGQKYLKESIESVLNQSYSNFELIIVNDGSTDNSVELINSFKDERIKLFHNKENMGLAFTENKCIELSNGEYLAKLDCDDIALPQRLELQVAYFEENPQIGILGSAVSLINEDGKDLGRVWRYPAASELIPSLLLFQNYFAHPAIMMRRSALAEIRYRSEYNPAEDYDLWTRLITNTKGYNLQQVLTKYRVHKGSISIYQQEKQINSEKQTHVNQLERLGLVLKEKELRDLESFRSNSNLSKNELRNVSFVLKSIKKANKSSRIYDQKLLERVIHFLWIKYVLKHPNAFFYQKYLELRPRAFFDVLFKRI